MVSKLGLLCIDKVSLEASKSSLSISFVKIAKGYSVTSKFYEILIGEDGQIHSWLDRRTKHQPRELCRDRLN